MTYLSEQYPHLRDRDDILSWARRFSDQFPWPESAKPPPVVTFLTSSRTIAADAAAEEIAPPLLISEVHNRHLTLHLFAETLVGLPRPVLQGALDLELSLHSIRIHAKGLSFNFSRSILPLFPVSGMGVQIIRHLVFQIEDGVKRQLATRQLMDGCHGQAQLLYLFHKIVPPADGALAYSRMADHAWMRALFLSRKFKEYAAVDFVAAKKGSPTLRQFWRDCNSYFSSRDQLVLDRLAKLSAETAENNYAHQVVEMFEIVKREFLIPHPNAL
jgi:hypothetical protein